MHQLRNDFRNPNFSECFNKLMNNFILTHNDLLEIPQSNHELIDKYQRERKEGGEGDRSDGRRKKSE